MKALPNKFYVWPLVSETTMTKEDLKELLLATEGCIMACGQSWNIISEDIGADVYKVRLVKRMY
jgi:hypothetical protein